MGRPPAEINIRGPMFRAASPERRERIVATLTQILLADLEREAAEQAALSQPPVNVSARLNEEAKAS
jgi:hypothetical protein